MGIKNVRVCAPALTCFAPGALPLCWLVQVMYLNNVPVHTTGEKYIIVDDRKVDDSTIVKGLKVMTKRKGGKGFRVG